MDHREGSTGAPYITARQTVPRNARSHERRRDDQSEDLTRSTEVASEDSRGANFRKATMKTPMIPPVASYTPNDAGVVSFKSATMNTPMAQPGAAYSRSEASTDVPATAFRKTNGRPSMWKKLFDATAVPVDIPSAAGGKTTRFQEGAAIGPVQTGKPTTSALPTPGLTAKAPSTKDTTVFMVAVPKPTTDRSPRSQNAVPPPEMRHGKLRTSGLAAPAVPATPKSTPGAALTPSHAHNAPGKIILRGVASDRNPTAFFQPAILVTGTPSAPVNSPEVTLRKPMQKDAAFVQPNTRHGPGREALGAPASKEKPAPSAQRQIPTSSTPPASALSPEVSTRKAINEDAAFVQPNTRHGPGREALGAPASKEKPAPSAQRQIPTSSTPPASALSSEVSTRKAINEKSHGAPVGQGDHASEEVQPNGIRSPIPESSGEDEAEEGPRDPRRVAQHSLLYFVWVGGSVLFVLFAFPLAMLLFPSNRDNASWSGLRINGTSAALAVCIDDTNDAPLCTEYPKSNLRFDRGDWKASTMSEAPPQDGKGELTEKHATVFRPVICVLNLGSQDERQRFKASDLQGRYCTVLLWESVSLGTPEEQRPGRRGTLAVGRRKFGEMVEHVKALRTGQNSLPIYVTLGGERDDSPAFAALLQDTRWKSAIAESIHMFDGVINGVNINWNHPQDHCDRLGATGFWHLHAFVRQLKGQRTAVMITVPPSRELVRRYALHESLLDILSYVVVTTHKLQPCVAVVACNGARQFAATAFHEVRTAYDARYRHKFAYSISVRADIFLARKPALREAAYPAGPVFYGMSSSKGNMYIALSEVCQKQAQKSEDDECSLALMDSDSDPDNVTWHLVATYTTPDQMRRRMTRAYDDGMGDAAVAVFDTHLDDLSGKCEVVKGQPRVSPLLAAIATTSNQLGRGLFSFF